MAEKVTPRLQVEPGRPGRYTSPFERYPGYIQFPYPLMLHHFRVWWEAGVAPLKGLTTLDFESFQAEWKGAKALVLECGEWGVTGVASADAKADSLPLEVATWVIDCCDDYIGPNLSQKKRRSPFTATWPGR